MNNQKNSRLLEIEKEYKIWEELQVKYANDEEFYHYISIKLQSLDEEADQIRREAEESQELPITRVELKPLQKIAQLKKLYACNCIETWRENNSFTMTFKLDNGDTEKRLQDLTIIFEKRSPSVYISKPYKVSVKSSKWKESTQKFMMNFLRYIFEIQNDLINRTLQNGPTQEFELHERGRIRPITSIQIRDRIVRHSLCDEVLLPEVRKHIIYDNCASIKGRGISQQRKRFEIHLHKYYQLYGNDGYILFGDFSKFYDNIIHEIAKRELLKLFNDDEFIDWLLTLIFKGFQIDVSYMSDEEYEACMTDTFNKLEYRNIPKEKLTGEKWMEKSVNIGDQLSQVIGIYYPYPIDNYVKYVRQQKFYGRYMDDWYIMNPSKEELEELLENVCKIAAELGIHINRKKTRIVKISSKYKFLQIKYTLTDTGKVIKRINPDRVTAMRRKLKKLAVKVGHEEADYDNVENMFRGWMGGHYKLLSREQRKNLIQLYEDLFSKKITIVNKKLIVSDRSA